MTICSRPHCGGTFIHDTYGDLLCSMCSRPYGPQEQPRLITQVTGPKAKRVILPVFVPPGADLPPPTGYRIDMERRKAHCEALLEAGVSSYGAALESDVSERTAQRLANLRKAAAGCRKYGPDRVVEAEVQ